MRVHVVLEAVFQRTPDGAVFTATPMHYAFFERYLEIFSDVEVVARVEDVGTSPPGWRPVEGKGVRVRPLPAYRGLLGYLRQRRAVTSAVRAAITDAEALILRVPSPLAGMLSRALQQRPFAVVAVGDPWDVFAPGVVRHPLRPLIRWHLTRQMRWQCANARAASYVTNHTLQQRYPCPQGMSACSDVDLTDGAFVQEVPARVLEVRTPIRLVMVGSLAQLYKGPDVLLDALARCRTQGVEFALDLIGDGHFRSLLELQAVRLGLTGHVRFLGQLPAGAAIREHLDRADGFVLPSRTEGLPRALIEAMARGLPCLASRVGGIPELLHTEDLVTPGDADALATRLRERFGDRAWRQRAAQRNLLQARAFHVDHLDRLRTAFLQQVHDTAMKAGGA